MKRRMLLLLTCCIIGIGMVMAQTSKVTGKVLSEEDGEAVIGATVMVKGTNIGTVTDADGLFSLSNVPGSAKELEVSYVGMEAQIVRIQPNLTIRMRTSSEMLDEVLITGTYGSAKKLGSMVGSVAAVKFRIAQVLILRMLFRGRLPVCRFLLLRVSRVRMYLCVCVVSVLLILLRSRCLFWMVLRYQVACSLL